MEGNVGSVLSVVSVGAGFRVRLAEPVEPASLTLWAFLCAQPRVHMPRGLVCSWPGWPGPRSEGGDLAELLSRGLGDGLDSSFRCGVGGLPACPFIARDADVCPYPRDGRVQLSFLPACAEGLGCVSLCDLGGLPSLRLSRDCLAAMVSVRSSSSREEGVDLVHVLAHEYIAIEAEG